MRSFIPKQIANAVMYNEREEKQNVSHHVEADTLFPILTHDQCNDE